MKLNNSIKKEIPVAENTTVQITVCNFGHGDLYRIEDLIEHYGYDDLKKINNIYRNWVLSIHKKYPDFVPLTMTVDDKRGHFTSLDFIMNLAHKMDDSFGEMQNKILKCLIEGKTEAAMKIVASKKDKKSR